MLHLRKDFEGVNGERLIITGNILDMSCQSLKDGILDVWQANSSGNFYNEGFSLRDKIKEDNNGNIL